MKINRNQLRRMILRELNEQVAGPDMTSNKKIYKALDIAIRAFDNKRPYMNIGTQGQEGDDDDTYAHIKTALESLRDLFSTPNSGEQKKMIAKVIESLQNAQKSAET